MNELVILGEKHVHDILLMAPKNMTNAIAHFMWKERLLFVGNKSKMGSFGRSLSKKKRKSYPGNWSKVMGRAFTGNINHPEQLDGMELSMGVIDKWKKRLPFLEMLSTGGTVTPQSSDWMMIPFYKNLRSIGLFGRIGSNAGNKNNWTKWRAENQARLGDFVPFHGKLLVFGDIPKEERSGSHFNRHLGQLHRKLLFIGVKKSTIKKQFDFDKAFERRKPAIVNRANKMVEKTVLQIERGKMWTQ